MKTGRTMSVDPILQVEDTVHVVFSSISTVSAEELGRVEKKTEVKFCLSHLNVSHNNSLCSLHACYNHELRCVLL